MALIQKVKDEEERKKKAEPTPANGAATSSPHDSRISSADPIIAQGNTDYNMQRYLPTDDALKREIEAYGDQPRDTYDQATETEELPVDTRNIQTTSTSEKSPSSSAGQKIYPLTQEQLDQEEDWVIEALEELKAEMEASNARSQAQKS